MSQAESAGEGKVFRLGWGALLTSLLLVSLGSKCTPADAQDADSKASAHAVAYFNSQDVAASFAKGSPGLLFQGAGYAKGEDGKSNFELHTSTRKTPGTAELHDQETDVIYVVEGSATCITGGTIVHPQTVRAGQIRGTRIDGGESHQLTKGSVIVIPNGIPHWFSQVREPIMYFVVKVR